MSSRSAEAMLSSSCSTVRAPRITLVTAGCASSHASETRAELDPCASATRRTSSRIAHVRSWPFRGVNASIPRSGSSPRRVAPVGVSSRRYLPVSQPPASGDHGSSPIPASSDAGTISDSISRTSSEYCGCSVTGGVHPRAFASPTAFVSCQPR
ncbi:hypothetical protein VV38_12015 [Clavibacter nebraskensis]|nr:hypothetical protein VV38_12015 [Clavibacter nebraskensis]OAH18499.1 hypothetical protein A3Q38_11765 [Clavibacter nebraskensis]